MSNAKTMDIEEYKILVALAVRFTEEWYQEKVYSAGHYKNTIFHQTLLLLLNNQLTGFVVPVTEIQENFKLFEEYPPKEEEKKDE